MITTLLKLYKKEVYMLLMKHSNIKTLIKKLDGEIDKQLKKELR